MKLDIFTVCRDIDFEQVISYSIDLFHKSFFAQFQVVDSSD